MIFVPLSSCRPDSSTQLVNANQRKMATGARVRRRHIRAITIGTATMGQMKALMPSSHQMGKATNATTSGQVTGRRGPLVLLTS